MDWKHEEGRFYSTNDEGQVMAEVTYVRKGNGCIDIDHVYVDPSLRGQGAAGETMKVVADYIRKQGLKATATCSYANAWFQKNEKEYSDIISSDMSNQALACKIDSKH
jgi:uncharacterized protein